MSNSTESKDVTAKTLSRAHDAWNKYCRNGCFAAVMCRNKCGGSAGTCQCAKEAFIKSFLLTEGARNVEPEDTKPATDVPLKEHQELPEELQSEYVKLMDKYVELLLKHRELQFKCIDLQEKHAMLMNKLRELVVNNTALMCSLLTNQ
jgi:hypothetical protein